MRLLSNVGLTVLASGLLLCAGCMFDKQLANEDESGVHSRAMARLGPVLAYPGAHLYYPVILDQEQHNGEHVYSFNTKDAVSIVDAYYTSHLGISSLACPPGTVACSDFETSAQDGSKVFLTVATVNQAASPLNGQTVIGFKFQ